MLFWFYIALFLLLTGAFAALLAHHHDFWASRCGVWSASSGAVAALIGAVSGFWGSAPGSELHWIIQAPDFLDSFFLLPIAVLGFFCAIYSVGYLREHGAGRQGLYWGFFNLTLAAMIAVPLAADPVSFLVFWELMGTASWVLVAYDYTSQKSRRAAWIYLLAGHAGLFLLIPMFLIYSGTWQVAHPAVALFVTGVLGFGLKAGFPLLHVWLPEAHPAAPAPVSALMSGAMINLGIYGILNYAILPDGPFVGYGYTLVAIGVVGSCSGAISAFAQNNLKRLLACSSVENMGIVTIGIGLGLLGSGIGNSAMSFCGFCGAFIHLWNHSALKGTLFLGAGEVFRSSGTLNMDLLGGMLKKIPLCGNLFAFSGLALSGLPPFNGFLGEFAIYLGAFAGLSSGNIPLFGISLLAILALALTGGVVSGAFARAIGAVFLGLPRSEAVTTATPTPRSIKFALYGLTGVSLVLLLTLPFLTLRLVALTAGLIGCGWEIQLFAAEFPILLKQILLLFGAGVLLFGVIWFCRCNLLKKRTVTVGPTWDCGYAAPSPRMEYTATAIAQFLAWELRLLSRFQVKFHPVRGYFPTTGSAAVKAPDPGSSFFWEPLFKSTAKVADKVHLLQSGLLHCYILLMVLAVLAMLIWGFWGYHAPEAVEDLPLQSAQVEELK